jgi:SAM-dependent methyltransferase
MTHDHDHGTLWQRIRDEFRYWGTRHWTFKAVGDHWDSVEHYDDINEETYSYFQRFVDGLRLSDLEPDSYVLDICSRSGNGTLYFHEHGKVGKAVCADVSEYLGSLCRRRLGEAGFENYRWVKIDNYDLPFEDGEFDAILYFETIEHFSEPEKQVLELGRVTKQGGTMILTTPNVLWEPIHALAAITTLHHSEGPHRFIPVRRLKKMIADAGFVIEKYETTVLIPGGPDFLIKFGIWIERHTRRWLMPLLGLRRVMICRKQ